MSCGFTDEHDAGEWLVQTLNKPKNKCNVKGESQLKNANRILVIEYIILVVLLNIPWAYDLDLFGKERFQIEMSKFEFNDRILE